MDYKQLLTQHLALVDRLVRFVARRHHLSASDADEFASYARFKLVDRNFAILRKFEGRSSINTYLAVVIERLCLDFCIAKWGKWRPSASARRLGPVAILLEQLTVREGITFDEAVGTLQTNHGVSLTREELHELWLQLPIRTLRRGAVDAFETTDAQGQVTDAAFEHRDDEHLVERVQEALVAGLASLAPEDRRIVRLRFERGMPVVDIARALRLESKPLYRRLDHIIRALRSELQRRGIDESEITRVIGHPTLTLSGVLAAPPRRSSH